MTPERWEALVSSFRRWTIDGKPRWTRVASDAAILENTAKTYWYDGIRGKYEPVKTVIEREAAQKNPGEPPLVTAQTVKSPVTEDLYSAKPPHVEHLYSTKTPHGASAPHAKEITHHPPSVELTPAPKAELDDTLDQLKQNFMKGLIREDIANRAYREASIGIASICTELLQGFAPWAQSIKQQLLDIHRAGDARSFNTLMPMLRELAKVMKLGQEMQMRSVQGARLIAGVPQAIVEHRSTGNPDGETRAIEKAMQLLDQAKVEMAKPIDVEVLPVEYEGEESSDE